MLLWQSVHVLMLFASEEGRRAFPVPFPLLLFQPGNFRLTGVSMLPMEIKVQIKEFTARGNKYLAEAETSGDVNIYSKAIQQFVTSYKLALLLNDEEKVWCAFNLGAAHVAGGDPSRGITILETIRDHMLQNPNAQKVSPQSDCERGDVYYNLGCGFKQKSEVQNAKANFDCALEEYRKHGSSKKIAETLIKLANIHLLAKDYEKAKDCFSEAAKLYEGLKDYDNAGHCMLYEADAAVKNRTTGDSADLKMLLEKCCRGCQKVEKDTLRGRLMCEIGILYSQLGFREEALACYQACIDTNTTLRNRAIALQNAGVILMTMRLFERAHPYLEQAAQLHGKLGNRHAQGECFCNLGYTQVQLEEYGPANESYLHSLQAFKDTEDKRCQCQAIESLGSLAQHVGDLGKAQKYYMDALAVQGANKNNNVRIVGKLETVLERKIREPERKLLAIADRPYSNSPSPREPISLDIIQSPNNVHDGKMRVPQRRSGKKGRLKRGRRSYSDVDARPIQHIARGLSNITGSTIQTLDSVSEGSFSISSSDSSLQESGSDEDVEDEKNSKYLLRSAFVTSTAPLQRLTTANEPEPQNPAPKKLRPKRHTAVRNRAAGSLLESDTIAEEVEEPESARSSSRTDGSTLTDASLTQVYRKQLDKAERRSDEDDGELTSVTDESSSSSSESERTRSTAPPTKLKVTPTKPKRHKAATPQGPTRVYENDDLYTQSLKKSLKPNQVGIDGGGGGATSTHLYESIKTVNFSPNKPEEKIITPDSEHAASAMGPEYDDIPEEIPEEIESPASEDMREHANGDTAQLSALHLDAHRDNAIHGSDQEQRHSTLQDTTRSEPKYEVPILQDPPVGFTSVPSPPPQQGRPLPETPAGKNQTAPSKKKRQKQQSRACVIM